MSQTDHELFMITLYHTIFFLNIRSNYTAKVPTSKKNVSFNWFLYIHEVICQNQSKQIFEQKTYTRC